MLNLFQALYIFSFNPSLKTCEVGITTLISGIKKWTFRELKLNTQGHTTYKKWN